MTDTINELMQAQVIEVPISFLKQQDTIQPSIK